MAKKPQKVTMKKKPKSIGQEIIDGLTEFSKSLQLSQGHQPHRSGAGKHPHKGTKRQRTRQMQKRKAIGDKV